MAEMGYKIYSGDKHEKEKGLASGYPLPKVTAEAIMNYLSEQNPVTDYWLVKVAHTPESSKRWILPRLTS